MQSLLAPPQTDIHADPYLAQLSAGTLSCEACCTTLQSRPIGGGLVLLQCAACGHIIRDIGLSATAARAHAWGGRQTMDRLRLALTWRRLSRYLNQRSHEKIRMAGSDARLDILEFGYGAGLTLQRLIRMGHRVSGVERHLLRTDAQTPALQGATLYDAWAEDVELPYNAFDIVIAVHVIEHLTDPERVFRKIAASLKPGGIFYCMTPNAKSYGLTLFGRHWWNMEDPTHYRFFSQCSLTTMLGNAGFASVYTNIVREDSLTIEANSVLRALTNGDQTHGILHKQWAPLASIALTPLSALARLFVPRLSPSIEGVAVMGTRSESRT